MSPPGFADKIIMKLAYILPVKEYQPGKDNLIFADWIVG